MKIDLKDVNDMILKLKTTNWRSIATEYAVKYKIDVKDPIKFERFILTLRKKKSDYMKTVEKLRLNGNAANVYEVERIEKFKMDNGKRLFYVKWVGYDSSENSWRRKVIW